MRKINQLKMKKLFYLFIFLFCISCVNDDQTGNIYSPLDSSKEIFSKTETLNHFSVLWEYYKESVYDNNNWSVYVPIKKDEGVTSFRYLSFFKTNESQGYYVLTFVPVDVSGKEHLLIYNYDADIHDILKTFTGKIHISGAEGTSYMEYFNGVSYSNNENSVLGKSGFGGLCNNCHSDGSGDPNDPWSGNPSDPVILDQALIVVHASNTDPSIPCITIPCNGSNTTIYIGPGNSQTPDGYDQMFSYEDEAPSCKSFQFKKINNTTNWQEAGVKNIAQGFISFGSDNTLYLGGVHFSQTIYFGLPVTRANGDFYSTSEAANLSAQAMYSAFRDTNNFFVTNPGSSTTALNNYFLNKLNYHMQQYGGTASKYPSNGASSIIKNYKDYWFVPDEC